MDVFEALAEARATGRAAVLVTVLTVAGEAPSAPGAKLLVAGGTVAAGTLGCSEFDTAGVELAGELDRAAAESGAAVLRRRVVFGHGTERALELFAERYEPRPAVVVVGNTPVGQALAELARVLGRRVVLIADDPLARLAAEPVGERDAVVLTDHDAGYVDAVLQLVLPGAAAFVGMLGSRRHAPAVLDRLRAGGVREPLVARLRSPCGLDLGGRAPAEIALSIMAEIVAAGNGRSGGRLELADRAGAAG